VVQPLKVAIAGGSLGGLFAGVLLQAAGHDVTVYERSKQGLDGRGAGLVGQREVFAILRAIGCEHVARVGVVARERIFLDRAGHVVDVSATPQTQISWDKMFRSFREHLPDARYVQGREVLAAGETEQAAFLKFDDGGTEEADLVIGADGVGSVVRKALAGEDAAPTYAGYAAWRGLYPEADLPSEAAETFLERFAFFNMPRSHILGYLVAGPDGSTEPGRRRYNWVWYRPTPVADGSLARAFTDDSDHVHTYSLARGTMPADARETLMLDAKEILPPQFSAAVAAESAPFVQAIFDYTSPAMASKRIALLGDAAFVVRPHTAMGVSKAAGDALALRDQFAKVADLTSALTTYDRERRAVGNEIAAYGRRLGASFD
jgi:2-polyprenyl-6-methoxyphenol hydroxylase-like FAD-dependent oxidoreductase